MISKTEAAYIAGLFDGEGTITYKKYREKKKDRKGNPRYSDTWRVSMEIAMTDASVLRWLHLILGCGTLRKKPRHGKHLTQWRWRCVFRDAYYVARVIWPYAHTKLPKINQIISHYKGKMMEGKVVDIKQYRKAMNLE